ncbi:MAG: sensor histidine kinase [Hyphomicrobiaceae bacterium]
MTALGNFAGALFRTTAFRLALAAVVLFVAAAGLIVALMFWQTNTVLTEQSLSTVTSEISVLQREARTGGIAALKAAVLSRSLALGPGLYYLSDQQGRKIAGNLSRLPPELSGLPKGGVFRYRNEPLARASGDPTQAKQLRLAFAIPVDVGGLKLYVGRDIEDQRQLASRVRLISLIGFGGLAALGVLGGLLVSWMLLRRVEDINSASKVIMSGDLSQRLPVTGSGDELDSLAQSFNIMLERIELLMSGLREVSDNIAHDLKTPLNRLRNRAEAALRDPRGVDAQREGLEATIEAADELMTTFNALLLIARLEARALEESATKINVANVVNDVAELYEPVAEEAELTLRVADSEAVEMQANQQLLTQAVANLIDNAIKYSARQTAVGAAQADRSVTVSVTRNNDWVEIAVGDRGPGIAPEDRERVLKRFVRLEKSRTAPGTGLGLSLVAAVSRLHKGEVRLEDNKPGLRVVMTLPIALDKTANTTAS